LPRPFSTAADLLAPTASVGKINSFGEPGGIE
jgi:hypothetical protein